MKRRVLFAFLAILCLMTTLVVITACGAPDDNHEDVTYRVVISLDEGVEIDGENPVDVKLGEDAVFKVVFQKGYEYKSAFGAEYDYDSGTLTVKNVTKNTNIDLLTQKESSEDKKTYVYVFSKDSKLDTSSVQPGRNIPEGVSIKLTAGDDSRAFLGWTLDKPLAGGGKLLSELREFEFLLNEDVVTDGVLTVYSNYRDENTLYYNPNGGTVDTSSVNMTAKEFYTAKVVGGNVVQTLGAQYLNFFECASSFYDDGTFTKEGYVLKEYNTKSDGTGEAYSLGSKVPLTTDGEPTTLYCIWSQNSHEYSFIFESVTYSLPDKVSEDKAPHWVTEGIKITKYTGNDSVVTIPEKIGNKYVTAIGAGAFENKDIKTLVLNRRILKIEDGAFIGCSKLETIYYPDGLYSIGNEALDEASYENLRKLYVNATLAPRFMGAADGAFAVKMSRLLASSDMNRLIVIAGSSAYQGLGTEYLETLLGGKWRVVNFGTTRTTNGIIYLEAMQGLAHKGDVILYAPENSAYMMGETELYYKTLRDIEGMNNIFRYIDISNYSNVFGAFSDFNRNYRYTKAPGSYEKVCVNGEAELENPSYNSSTTNKYGDYLYSPRKGLGNYNDAYFVTMNNRMKSRYEGDWNNTENQTNNKDYTDLNNITWCSVDDPYYKDKMNMAINSAKSSGARVYFSFCPVDADSLVEGADSLGWLLAYDSFIKDTYDFDGIVGSCTDYIFDHSYFYDCAFHLNDYGRTWRTYQLYLDLCEILDIDGHFGPYDFGTDFDGCLFEENGGSAPLVPWEPKN